ncbi:amidohydrolase family protein, partial [bacterium]|nr:amidohydrolase family protein [bacterium]
FEGIFFGDALHRELAFMVEFGATPYQALQTSTSHANDFLEHKRGQIAEGYFADLVVLAKNPISDINNTREISTVFMNGEEIQRKLLDLGN